MDVIKGRFAVCMLIAVGFLTVFSVDAIAEVKKGDLVKVHYTAKLENGEVFYSTDPQEIANAKKADWFQPSPTNEPELVVAGEQAMFPGIGENIIGLSEGETKTVTLAPEQAFGPSDPEKQRTFPREVSYPIDMEMGPREFVGRFNKFPVEGAVVDINPYIRAEVVKVTEETAELKLSAEDGRVEEDEVGKTVISVTDKEVKMFLEPDEGAKIPGTDSQGRPMEGRITTVNATSLVVDYNQPMLGKTIVIDMKVVEVVDDKKLQNAELDWRTPDGEDLGEFRGQGKPVFAVMHRESCGWCTRYFEETLKDKRILMLEDEFIWVEVDTDEHKKIAEKYNLEGTPLTVILSEKGDVIQRLGGFKPAPALYPTLLSITNN